MQWLAEVCVRRPVFATVLILMLTVVGAFSYFRLGVDRFPKVDFPVVSVVVRLPGASPEEVETDVTQQIEEAVNTISGIDQLFSFSSEGVCQVSVSFQLEKDINIASQEVRDKVSSIMSELPVDVEPPVIDKVDPDAAPILDLALTAPGDIRELTEYADKVVRRRLESISGVGQVRVIGGRKRQINIWLDPQRLQAYNLTSADVERSLGIQNIQVPGGRVDQGSTELTLRTRGRVQKPEEFNDIVVAKKGSSFVRIRDIGRAEDSVEEAATVANKNGTPTVLLSIRKQSGLNTVATVDAIKARLKEVEQTLPANYKMEIVRDQSLYIRTSTHAVQEHLVVGSILAALVVLLFLSNIRTTVISAIAIPASIISTFGLMYAMGFTLNGLTLLALTLSVGIVIDDAIVVLENIYRFVEEKGMRPFEAAIEGTREIGLAVMATTFSLIAVFLPVAFMSGIVGRFMNSFGLTMAFAIFVSLIVAFTLTPMLSSRWIKVKPRPEGPETPDGMPVGLPEQEPEGAQPAVPVEDNGHAARHARSEHGSKESPLFRVIDLVYTAILKWAMRHRWAVVLLCILTVLSMGWVVPRVPKNFLPEEDEAQFQISIRTPEGTSLVATEALCDRISEAVRALPDTGILYTVVTIGNNNQLTPNLGTIFVKMSEVETRPGKSQQKAMQRVRNEVLPRFGNLRASVELVQAFSVGGGPNATVQYYIAGPDLSKLTEYAQKVVAELKKVPGVVDADSTVVAGKPELGVNIDRQRAADLGVSVADIANAMRILVGGQKVTNFYQNGEQYEVHLRAELPFRNDPSVISQLSVPSTTLGSVKLDQVVTFDRASGPATINRLDRKRQETVYCNVLPGYSSQAAQDAIAKTIRELRMPPGYTSGPAGTAREQVKAFMAFLAAFLLSIVFMYLILAAQFESWVHPITILIALPLTVPFALIALLLTGQSLNIFSMLGILVLFGVVKKNGILQVDHTNQLRARGMDRFDAIITANRDRLRPILMTTVAFVAGMMPPVFARGGGGGPGRGIGFAGVGGGGRAPRTSSAGMRRSLGIRCGPETSSRKSSRARRLCRGPASMWAQSAAEMMRGRRQKGKIFSAPRSSE